MDGYSHHEQKKRDLQVSNQGDRLYKGELNEVKGEKEMGPAYVHSVVYTLSANNSALCLGFKSTMCKKNRFHAFNCLDPSLW
jgi:hypothetical protein